MFVDYQINIKKSKTTVGVQVTNLLHWGGLWLERSTGFEFGVGELTEICHHTEFVTVGVDHLLGCDELGHTQPVVC